MKMGVVATAAAKWAMLGAAVMLAGIANAAEIRVIGSPGTREPYTLLVPGLNMLTGRISPSRSNIST